MKQEQDDKDLMIVLEDLPLVKVIVKLTMSTQYGGAETSSNLLCRRWKISSWQQVRPHSLGKII